MTERESPLLPENFNASLIAVSWQLGDDVCLIRRTVASKDEEIGRVLDRVLMEAFVLGHLREVDAFLDPKTVRNRWQAFVRRNGHDEPLRINQTFAQANLQQADRLLLRPLPQTVLPAESLTEDLLQQPPKTSGFLWVLLTLLIVLFAVGVALWFLRATLWPPSPPAIQGKQRPHPPLPALPAPKSPRIAPNAGAPATTEPSAESAPADEPSTTTEPNTTEPNTAEPNTAEPSAEAAPADAGSDPAEEKEEEEEEAAPTPPRRVLLLKRPSPFRKGPTKRLLHKGSPRQPTAPRPSKRRRALKKRSAIGSPNAAPSKAPLRRKALKRKPPTQARPAASTEP